ncbi:N-acyl homoserine lactonase family protein [uncultured Eudoraea sp.]|uniref:N-acyl homoserine lactonase family protein n=1 Tax=uncultured Eudoraea sp. TaxID=1035614 RepID=UPI00262777EA|nr:N-acyl homoserine lactonase family protein [uncultured Eudoraea sp.]
MKNYLVLVVVILLFACKDSNKQANNISGVQENISGPEVKLYTFDGGTVIVNTLGLFAQDSTYKGQSKEFADAFYVIQHPKGNLMWDAGLPESLVGLPEPYTSPDGAFTVSRKDSVLNQLKEIGMTPEDFQYISLSHTHFDHSGHANTFKDATWLVQKDEYDFVTGKEVKEKNPEMYNAIRDLKQIKKIKGDFDVFGDGTVVLKYMPGHTPGHQVLFLDLKEHGPLLLSGDLYHFYENREYKRIPIFNYDVVQTGKSMKEFEAFAREKGAKVYLQHQKEDFKKMPKAPQYLN